MVSNIEFLTCGLYLSEDISLVNNPISKKQLLNAIRLVSKKIKQTKIVEGSQTSHRMKTAEQDI